MMETLTGMRVYLHPPLVLSLLDSLSTSPITSQWRLPQNICLESLISSQLLHLVKIHVRGKCCLCKLGLWFPRKFTKLSYHTHGDRVYSASNTLKPPETMKPKIHDFCNGTQINSRLTAVVLASHTVMLN